MLDLNNQLNLMHLEIKKVKDYHKEEINHHRLLVEKEKNKAASITSKCNKHKQSINKNLIFKRLKTYYN